MTQYCYLHTPVTNSILTWNYSVDQVLCILGAVVAMRIHFGKRKASNIAQIKCLSVLLNTYIWEVTGSNALDRDGWQQLVNAVMNL